MINYEIDPSPFFSANKSYCESIELQLKSLKYEYSGFCNCFGYEIETKFSGNSYSYELKFIKHQTTRGGPLPMDALDYAGVELMINGLDPQLDISFGKNKLKRLTTSKELAKRIPSPFYFSNSNTTNIQGCIELANLLMENKIDSLKIKNGKASLKIDSPSGNVFSLLPELERALATCI